MFKPHKGTCVLCATPNTLIVVKKGLCQWCNHKSKGKKVSSSTIKAKPKKATGELALFKEIWEERPHRSEISGDPLEYFDIRCFSHTLTKQAYPRFRLLKANIRLVTPDEHHEWEFTDRKDPKWNELKKDYERLKRLYYEQADDSIL